MDLHIFELLAGLQTWRALIFSRVCLSVCPWPALLPFIVDRFWWNLVTRTLLWSSLATTIMVQIGCRGTVQRLFENFRKSKFSKITEFEYQISGPSFFASVLLVYCEKKLDSIQTKLTEEIHFEFCPYRHNAGMDATPSSNAMRPPGFAASANALRRARSTSDDPICCWHKVWHRHAANRYVQKLDIGRVHKFGMEHVFGNSGSGHVRNSELGMTFGGHSELGAFGPGRAIGL